MIYGQKAAGVRVASLRARVTSRSPHPLLSVGLDFDGAVRLAAFNYLNSVLARVR